MVGDLRCFEIVDAGGSGNVMNMEHLSEVSVVFPGFIADGRRCSFTFLFLNAVFWDVQSKDIPIFGRQSYVPPGTPLRYSKRALVKRLSEPRRRSSTPNPFRRLDFGTICRRFRSELEIERSLRACCTH